ncbi:MAG: hypothetical protein IPP22_09270 [Nitrosomonas sp.]|nr:hypothetical protein [Nitrosomonas sp.]
MYDKPFLLDSDSINHELRIHPQWLGGVFVEMCPALVTVRLGKFESEPDILYKQDFFIPDPGTSPMSVNIVDVLKSRAKWITRSKYIKRIFTEDTYSQIFDLMDHPEVVIANEYYLHEAGHFLGYDVITKYSDGYFSPTGNTAWLLIYAEELRADLHAFGFGTILLPPREAAKILIYNIALRFGVHFEGITTLRIAPHGLTPYLLFVY